VWSLMFEAGGGYGLIVRNKANPSIADFGSGTDLQRAPPAACLLGPAQARCTNKSNFLRCGAGRGLGDGGVGCRTNEANSAAQPVVRNKANFRRAGPRGSQSCETNPISPAGTSLEGPVAAPWTECAKRTQFAPAWAKPGSGRTKDAKRTQFRPCHRDAGRRHSGPVGDLGPIVRNKPNFRGAKRSQFGAARAASGGRLYETKRIPGRAGWDEAAGAQDESQMCKTNPISGGTGSDEAPGVRDAGQTCKTKPISARQAGTRGPPPHWRAPRTPLAAATRPYGDKTRSSRKPVTLDPRFGTKDWRGFGADRRIAPPHRRSHRFISLSVKRAPDVSLLLCRYDDGVRDQGR